MDCKNIFLHVPPSALQVCPYLLRIKIFFFLFSPQCPCLLYVSILQTIAVVWERLPPARMVEAVSMSSLLFLRKFDKGIFQPAHVT